MYSVTSPANRNVIFLFILFFQWKNSFWNTGTKFISQRFVWFIIYLFIIISEL